jgi:hypothetical protein
MRKGVARFSPFKGEAERVSTVPPHHTSSPFSMTAVRARHPLCLSPLIGGNLPVWPLVCKHSPPRRRLMRNDLCGGFPLLRERRRGCRQCLRTILRLRSVSQPTAPVPLLARLVAHGKGGVRGGSSRRLYYHHFCILRVTAVTPLITQQPQGLNL